MTLNPPKPSKERVIQGDCLVELKKLPENSIDSIVTDPPYGLEFMGKEWDKGVPGVKFWVEMIRVLKPGGHLLSFGGSRTYHRMACAIEDAGFEIRDQIMWLYGSGFPKSLNIGTAVDKLQGNEREDLGWHSAHINRPETENWDKSAQKMKHGKFKIEGKQGGGLQHITKGNSKYEGWGTALKPANEPICVARKPLSEKTVALNVLKWGTGGINIDGSRVEGKLDGDPNRFAKTDGGSFAKFPDHAPVVRGEGRFPANLILDKEAGQMLGQPARFFYTAKSSKSERNKGLEGFEEKDKKRFGSGGRTKVNGKWIETHSERKPFKNNHPTVKPISLMRYLCKLVTPPKGIVLDPFLGSGTTAIAAKLEGFKCIGIEKEKDYIKIAKARIKAWHRQERLL